MIESEDGNKMHNRAAIKNEVVIISKKSDCATYPHGYSLGDVKYCSLYFLHFILSSIKYL